MSLVLLDCYKLIFLMVELIMFNLHYINSIYMCWWNDTHNYIITCPLNKYQIINSLYSYIISYYLFLTTFFLIILNSNYLNSCCLLHTCCYLFYNWLFLHFITFSEINWSILLSNWLWKLPFLSWILQLLLLLLYSFRIFVNLCCIIGNYFFLICSFINLELSKFMLWNLSLS